MRWLLLDLLTTSTLPCRGSEKGNAVGQRCQTSGGDQKGRALRGLCLTSTGPEEGGAEPGMGRGRLTAVRIAQSRQSLNPVGALRSKPLGEEEGTTHLGKPGPLPCGKLLKSDATSRGQLELTQI